MWSYARLRARDRSIVEGLQIVDPVLRSLDRDTVADPIPRIQPKTGSGLEAGRQGNEKVLRHITGLQTHILRAGAVDIQKQSRSIESLLDMDVNGAGNMPDLIGKLDGSVVITLLIHPGNLDVDRRGCSKVQNLRNDIRRLKEELHTGEFAGKALAKIVDVIPGGLPALRFELDQDFSVGGADGPGVAISKVDARIGQADVVENSNKFFFRDGTANLCIDLIGELRGFFDAKTGSGAIVKANLTRIDAGEEIAA